MKLHKPGFPRVLHQRQTPSAYEIKLMNRVSDLERLVYGEGNYKSFNLILREEAATREGGCRLSEDVRLRLLQDRIYNLQAKLISQGRGFEIDNLDNADNNRDSHHHSPSFLMLYVPDVEKWIVKEEDAENKK